MKVDFERDGVNDEVFVINWPDSQICFHLIRRGDKPAGVKEAVYVLMDKFRTKFYIGETGEVQGRFRTHKWQRDFWHCALVIEDRNGAFKKQDVRKWFEWRLFQIAVGRSREDKKYEILSSAGKQDDKSYLENRINDILAVCRFLGIPWGYASETEKHIKKRVVDRLAQHKAKGKRHPAPGFTYSMAGISDGDELVFTEGGQKVRARAKNKVEYQGAVYSLTGFVKRFMPANKRNKANSYQGPAFFTYRGELLTELRAKREVSRSVSSAKLAKLDKARDICVSGQNKTQLAKRIALNVDGKIGAFGGILQYFSRFKRCPQTGKWRKPLELIGIKFDKSDFVVDWHAAKMED